MKKEEHFDDALFRVVQAFDDFRGPVIMFLTNLLRARGTRGDLQLLAENESALREALKAARNWIPLRLIPFLDQVLRPGESVRAWARDFPPPYLVSPDQKQRFPYRGTLPPIPEGKPFFSPGAVRSGFPTHLIKILEITAIGQNGQWHYHLLVQVRDTSTSDEKWTWDLWMQGHYINGGEEISPEDVALGVRDNIRATSGLPKD